MKNDPGITRDKKTRRFTGNTMFSVVLLVVAIYGIISLVSTRVTLYKLQKEQSRLQGQLSEQSAQNQELEELVKNGDYEQLLERAAREKFDYVYEDEEVITVNGN